MFLQLFQSKRPKRDCLMNASERRKLENLPDRFPIYRGFIGKRGEGLSWTIDRTTGNWFASRFAIVKQFGKPKLIEGVANLPSKTRHQLQRNLISLSQITEQFGLSFRTHREQIVYSFRIILGRPRYLTLATIEMPASLLIISTLFEKSTCLSTIKTMQQCSSSRYLH